MNNTLQIVTLNVFTDDKGNFGNPVGIVLDNDHNIANEQRLKISQKLSFSELVFIDNQNSGKVSIYNPQQEVKFAGHALIGVSWYLRNLLKTNISFIKCLAGNIKTWEDSGLTWISSKIDVLPPWNFEQVENVENINPNKAHTVVWSWVDQNIGLIRARTFAPDWGIPEDEANGSGSMLLTATLKKNLEIIHGKGSLITTKFINDKEVAVGGRVVEVK